jgi:hypothetical protein
MGKLSMNFREANDMRKVCHAPYSPDFFDNTILNERLIGAFEE